MKSLLIAMLTALFLSGCATKAPISDSGNPESGLQQEAMTTETDEQMEEDEVLAVVNGEALTINEYNEKLRRLSKFERARYSGEEGHQAFLRDLILQKIMVQKAKEAELDKDAEVQKKIRALMQETMERVLMEALLKQEILDKVVVTDEEAKAYYDEHKEEFSEKEKAHARHILVKTEEEVQEIRKQLDEGADFAELATEKSADKHTAKKGGDLGFFERGKMIAEFEEVCFDMEIGAISDPVKTQFGYHIIKLEDKKEAGMKEFYEVSDDIKKKLLSGKQQEEHQKWIDLLEKEAKIKIETAFGGSSTESP